MSDLSTILPFSYRVIFSTRRRTVALQIKQGKVTVRAPTGCPPEFIGHFVAGKQHWVMQHLAESIPREQEDWLQQGKVPLLDSRLRLELLRGSRSEVTLRDELLVITVSSRVSDGNFYPKARELLQHWYKTQAQAWFELRVAEWSQKMALYPVGIKIGQWQSRWGYCNHLRQVGFNWRLLLAPAWVANYVVVHELAHLRYMNHSPAFWQLVSQFCGDAESARKWLKANQHLMML